MSSRLTENVVQLRTMLHQFEVAAGLAELTQTERDVLYAAFAALSAKTEPVLTEDILSNDLMQGVATATFHRSMRRLIERGYLSLAPGRRRGAYVVNNLPSDGVR